MSIQTQIDRINAVKARIGTNLVTQGVTVQPNAMLEEMAEQILSVGGKVTTEVYNITLASGLGTPTGNNSIHTLLTGNTFVKNNRSKATFAVFMYANTPVATGTKVHHSVYHGNINIASSNLARYGFSYCGSSASAIGFSPITNALTTNGYSCSFRTTSAGNLQIYVASDRTLNAGDYTLVLMCWED